MELLMIRHSSTRGNLLRQYVGSQDHPLAPEGVALAERRRGEMPPIDGLWVSPMLRCRQTAEILFPGVEQRLVDALKECDFGTFEGKTWAELKDNPIYQAWLVPARDSGPWRDPDVRYVRLCGATSGFLQLAAQQLRRIPSPGGGGEGAGLHPSGDAVSRLWVLLAAAAR